MEHESANTQSIDQGTIGWMLQKRELLSIQTMEKEYTPKDNVLILNVDAGTANQFIIDLIQGTVSGLNEKVRKGWFPHRAPEGYINDIYKLQGERDIIVDPVRFPMLRRAWDMMLTGSYSVPQILTELHQMGYRSKPHVRATNDRLKRSTLYRIFSNRFYAGYFLHKGQWYPGKHPPMVNDTEFREVQRLLGKEERIQPKKRLFTYAGMIRCGRCGCQIVGEIHKKTIKSDGREVIYTYYRCSTAKGMCDKKVVTEQYLENEIDQALAHISIRPQYRPILLKIWQQYLAESQKVDQQIFEQQQDTIAAKRRERDTLLHLRLNEMIDDEMFLTKKATLDLELRTLENDRMESATVMDEKATVTENILLFATEPKDRYQELSYADKRTVALHLGARYTLTDRKLILDINELLAPIKEYALEFEAEIHAFELTEFPSESTKNEAFEGLISTWGPRWDAIRIMALKKRLYFPELNLRLPNNLPSPNRDRVTSGAGILRTLKGR